MRNMDLVPTPVRPEGGQPTYGHACLGARTSPRADAAAESKQPAASHRPPDGRCRAHCLHVATKGGVIRQLTREIKHLPILGPAIHLRGGRDRRHGAGLILAILEVHDQSHHMLCRTYHQTHVVDSFRQLVCPGRMAGTNGVDPRQQRPLIAASINALQVVQIPYTNPLATSRGLYKGPGVEPCPGYHPLSELGATKAEETMEREVPP